MIIKLREKKMYIPPDKGIFFLAVVLLHDHWIWTSGIRYALAFAMPYIIEAGIRGGAYCCYLSGSGSSIIALSDKREYTIGYEMAETARTFGINGKTMVVPISDSGARVKVWLEIN